MKSKFSNWKVVVFCLLAATTFWFLYAMNKSYTQDIDIPISCEYDKDIIHPISPLPTSLRITATGTGWELFKSSGWTGYSTFKVPIKHIPLDGNINIGEVYKKIYLQLAPLTIKRTTFPYIKVELDSIVTHRFPIKVSLSSWFPNKVFESAELSSFYISTTGPSTLQPYTQLDSFALNKPHNIFESEEGQKYVFTFHITKLNEAKLTTYPTTLTITGKWHDKAPITPTIDSTYDETIIE